MGWFLSNTGFNSQELNKNMRWSTSSALGRNTVLDSEEESNQQGFE